ncbi:DNA primase [Helicobacter cappadocius]|uniref:DNA primase n=1 Tax=Helicobacter cappadocius TaxID=3063998 RepID=A0AA90PU19_9HELI|nr:MULTISPECIES: DNA primase [unclassified Helicobacter]MDO7253139.1 DNA primase [Helicobacter sp. faydin-H75]MDP2538735.1 DNA primase [Helicobacter sp. faydin-H76]
MITQTSIEALKATIDIVDIVGSYVDLRKSGSNFTACCPFHDEKTPSFMVNGSKGLYHCYGCGVGGDAIKFVMEYEKLNFVEAVEKIADLCNFTLEYEKNSIPKKDDFKSLEKVAKFYQKRLMELTEYRDYLYKRGVSTSSIEKFGLGFCGPSFETLRFVEQEGMDKKKLIELGVLGEDSARTYVRFAERIMFPIHSPAGKIVGFGGRTTKDNLPKYLNSPQTSQFNKSKLLYGYHIAKEYIYKYEQVIVTEGYLDVIMLHQAGFNTAVATLGTALTQDHLPILNKGNPKVILSYDGDAAGIKSAFRASAMLAKDSRAGGVVIFEGGLDPADMVFQKKTDELERLFSSPIPFVEFVFKQISLKYDLSDPLAKEKALKESSDFLHTLSPLLQEEYRDFVARILKIPLNLIVPSYKGSSKIYPKATTPLRNKTNSYDGLESLIIKYILEDKSLLDMAIEYIDERVFQYKRKEFCALCRGDFEDEGLIGIEINEELLLHKGGFKDELVMLILKYNQNQLEKIIADSDLNFQEKSFRIRQIKNNIIRLRKGELIGI